MPKEPQIIQAYPPGKREGHEKYSPLLSGVIRKSGKAMETTLLILSSLSYKEVEMGVEIDLLFERLDDGRHPGGKLSASKFSVRKLVVVLYCLTGIS